MIDFFVRPIRQVSNMYDSIRYRISLFIHYFSLDSNVALETNKLINKKIKSVLQLWISYWN